MGCVFGDFFPTDSYFKDIQKTVWEFWKTDKLDYKRWNSLRFNAQLENGYFLFPIGYKFDDIPELPNEPKKINITGLDRHVIEGFFTRNTKTIFGRTLV